MITNTDSEDSPSPQSDLAAVFACALSLHRACSDHQDGNPTFNISEAYHGFDQFMREIMRVGELFETWAIAHVLFEELEEVWPYLLEDRFAGACLTTRSPASLSSFDVTDCFSVALKLKLPLHGKNGLPIPIDLLRQNPLTSSRFKSYQIRSVREHVAEKEVHSFGLHDDPTDKSYGEIFYGLYGIEESGEAEHIADRSSYAEARSLAHAMIPSLDFPECPRVLPMENSR
jgi:hypothetical protein